LPLPGDWSIIPSMTKTLHIFPSAAAVEAFHRSKLEESGVILGVSALTLKRLTEELSREGESWRKWPHFSAPDMVVSCQEEKENPIHFFKWLCC
jgi:hypothetical protein